MFRYVLFILQLCRSICLSYNLIKEYLASSGRLEALRDEYIIEKDVQVCTTSLIILANILIILLVDRMLRVNIRFSCSYIFRLLFRVILAYFLFYSTISTRPLILEFWFCFCLVNFLSLFIAHFANLILFQSEIRIKKRKFILPIIKCEDQSHDCPICIDKIAIEEIMVYLPCKHYFHIDCIREWLEKKPICPLCRKKLYLYELR